METVIAAGLIVLIGCGVIASLLKLNATVGKLCGQVEGLAKVLAQHEQRIQRLENK
jgi:hypothetical protein